MIEDEIKSKEQNEQKMKKLLLNKEKVKQFRKLRKIY